MAAALRPADHNWHAGTWLGPGLGLRFGMGAGSGLGLGFGFGLGFELGLGLGLGGMQAPRPPGASCASPPSMSLHLAAWSTT